MVQPGEREKPKKSDAENAPSTPSLSRSMFYVHGKPKFGVDIDNELI